jgi:hypothetical protein
LFQTPGSLGKPFHRPPGSGDLFRIKGIWPWSLQSFEAIIPENPPPIMQTSIII